jgi:hypothetical protein
MCNSGVLKVFQLVARGLAGKLQVASYKLQA